MTLRLNLGCGLDLKNGYVNVDFIQPCNLQIDLSEFPWPWKNSSVSEILMLDFLEHFPYLQTNKIISECRRILINNGTLIIQVPDFEHCAMAALDMHHYLCNFCGNSGKNTKIDKDGNRICGKCGVLIDDISFAAIKRLYGGQDRKGNFHYTAFTKNLLKKLLKNNGFEKFELLEKHHQFLNWNFKIKAVKQND